MNTQFIQLMTFNGLEPSRVEYASDDIMYIGFCLDSCTGNDDGKWLIRRIKTDGNTQSFTYPFGKKDFTAQWSARAGYPYKIAEPATEE